MTKPAWTGLTERDSDTLIAYIRKLAKLMRLSDWTINLSSKPAEDGAYATCQVMDGRKHALIEVSSDFRTFALEDIRHNIVHELIHCHLGPLSAQLKSDLPELLGQPTALAFNRSATRNYEYAVDELAYVIASNMPLIKW